MNSPTCHRTAARLCALALLLGDSAVRARPQTSPIDDTGTATLEPVAAMRWQDVSPRAGNSLAMQGRVTVRVRLNLAPWVGQVGRIYLLLPVQQPGPVTAEWTTQGQLLPGQVTSGMRALVYSGRIDVVTLQDSLQMLLTVDGTRMRQNYNLTLRFEFDED